MLRVTTRPEYSVYTKDACSACCQVTLEAPDIEDDKRAPVSISLVLDRSGSMAGQKLDLVKKTTSFLLKQVKAGDHVGIVSYDDEVKVVAPLRSATIDNRAKADAAVLAIRTGGMTNLSGGLFQGLHQQLGLAPAEATAGDLGDSMQSSPQTEWEVLSTGDDATSGEGSGARDGVRAVFLFTDGLANRGITDSEKIVAATKKLLENTKSVASGGDSRTPPSISTFGFGTDHSEDLLNAISEAAGGTYYYIKKAEDIPTAFAEALGGLLSVYAQTVQLTLTPKNGALITKVHTGFDNRVEGDATIVTVPDIYAEEIKNLLVDMSIPAGADEQAAFLDVSVSYLNVPSAAFESGSTQFSVPRTDMVPDDLNPDEEIAAQRVRLGTAATLQDAVRLADAGQLEAAQNCLLEQQALLRGMAADKPAAVAAKQALLYDITQTLQGFGSTAAYMSCGKKYALISNKVHRAERSNAARYSSVPVQGASAAPPRRLPSNIMSRCGMAPATRCAMSYGGRLRNVQEQHEDFLSNMCSGLDVETHDARAPGGSAGAPPLPVPSAYTTKKQSAMSRAAEKAVLE